MGDGAGSCVEIGGSSAGFAASVAVARDKFRLSGGAEGQFPYAGSGQAGIAVYGLALGAQRVTGLAANAFALQGSGAGLGVPQEGVALGAIALNGMGGGSRLSMVHGVGVGGVDWLAGGGQATGFGPLLATAHGAIRLGGVGLAASGVKSQAAGKFSVSAQVSGATGRCGTAAGRLHFPVVESGVAAGVGFVGASADAMIAVCMAGAGAGNHFPGAVANAYGTIVLAGEAFSRKRLLDDKVYVIAQTKVVYAFR